MKLVTIEQVKKETGWELKVAKEVKEIEPPTLREIEVCRKTIDQYYILKPEWTIYLDK